MLGIVVRIHVLVCLCSWANWTGLYAATGDYPAWMGPDGTRSSDSGLQLVNDTGKARLLWQSEITLPNVYADPSNPAAFPLTHYASPVVADGLVFYAYPDASAEAPVDEVSLEKVRRSKNYKALPAEGRARLERGCRQLADDFIICLDAETGKTKWTRRFIAKGANPLYNTTYNATPIIADGRCYVLGSMAVVYCLDAKTGATIWQVELKESREFWLKHLQAWVDGPYKEKLASISGGGRMGHKEWYSMSDLKVSSPLLVNDVLICTDTGGYGGKSKAAYLGKGAGKRAVVGLDAKTGVVRWRTPCGASGAPKLWQQGDRSFALVATGGGLACIDVLTGKVRWRESIGVGGWGLHLIVGDILVTPGAAKTAGHGAAAYRLGDSGATKIWTIAGHANYTTPAAYKGHVFLRQSGGNKTAGIVCVELESGKEVKAQGGIGGSICNSIIIADDRLWFGWNGYLNADPQSTDLLKILGPTYERNSPFARNGWASPTVAQGRVYYRRKNRLMCADFRVAAK